MQAEWLKTLPLAGPLKVEPLYKGVANQVYKLRAADATYVVKLFCHDHPYGLDREQEVALQQHLALSQLAPEVIHFDANRGLLVQQYINVPDLTTSSIPESERIRALAEALSRIHQVQIDVPMWSLSSRLDDYLKALSGYDKQTATQFKQRLKKFRKALDAWGAHPVFCHNDLAMHHVFATVPATIIDWEYAGFGERLFDISNAILVNRLNTGQANSLINAYEGFTGVRIDRDQLEQWGQLATVINQLWYELHHHLQTE